MAGVRGSKPREKEEIIMNMKLGLLLRAMREFSGKSQRDVAASIGYENATLICNIEKGQNSVPYRKAMEFAAGYNPEEKYMLAAAIIRSVMPDVWEICVDVFGHLIKNDGNSHSDLTKTVDNWIEKQFKEYNIKL